MEKIAEKPKLFSMNLWTKEDVYPPPSKSFVHKRNLKDNKSFKNSAFNQLKKPDTAATKIFKKSLEKNCWSINNFQISKIGYLNRSGG